MKSPYVNCVRCALYRKCSIPTPCEWCLALVEKAKKDKESKR